MTTPRKQDERGSSRTGLSAQSADRELSSNGKSNALDWSRDLVLHTRDLLCIHDLKGQLLSINPEPARLLGYAVDELLRTPMREMLPLEFRPQFDGYLEKIARDGEAHGLLTLVTRSGEKRIWEYQNTLQRAEGAEPVVHGIAHDVTEQKRIEHELRKSERQVRLFIEHAPAALAMFDRDMRYLQVSRRWRTDLGLGDRNLLGLSFYEVLPEAPERWKEAHRRALAGEVVRNENDQWKRADGPTEWVRWEMRPWHETAGKIGGIVIFAEQITELKHAEEALRNSAAELLEAQRIGRMGSWYRDFEKDTCIYSEEACRLLGLDPGQTNLTVTENEKLFAPQEWQRLWQATDELVRTGKPDELEVEIRNRNGETGWALLHREPVFDEAGAVIGLRGAALDITARKRAQEALAASESRFRTVFEKSPVGIYLVDRSTGRFLRTNQRYCELVGRSEEELKSIDVLSVTHPDDRTAAREYLQGLAGGKISSFEREKRYIRPDGSIRWVYAAGVVLPEVSGETPFGVGIVQDITARKQAEEALRMSEAELREAQRLGRIGSWYRDLKTDTLTWTEQIDCVLGPVEKAQPLTFKQTERFFTPESWQRIVQTNATLIANGGSDELEVEFRRQDGTTGWAIMHREAVRDGAGHIVGMRGVGLDISERKRVEQALATLVQIRTSSSASFLAEMALQLAKCLGADDVLIGEQIEDQKVRTLALCRQGALIDNIVYDLRDTPCDQVATCGTCLFLSGVAEKFPGDPFLRQLGAEAYVGAPLRDSQGSVIGIVCAVSSRPWTNPDFARMTLELFSARIASEIERMRAEEALRRSEERYRLLSEKGIAGVAITSLEGRVIHCNDAWAHMFGFEDAAEAVGSKGVDRWPDPAERSAFVEEIKRCGSIVNRERRFRRKNGDIFWAFVNAVFLDGSDGPSIQSTVFDITERKRAEEALRASEERMRLAQQVAEIGTFERNMQTGEGIWTPETEKMFGLQPGQGPKSIEEFLSLIHPEDRQHVQRLFEESIATGSTSGEWRVVWPDGSVHWIDGRWQVFKDEQGRPLRAIGIDANITERKFAEETLRASVARERAHAKELETILDTLPIPVLIAHDPQCTEITANRAGYEHLRLPPGTNVSFAAWQEHKPPHRFLQDGVEVTCDKLPMDRAAATGRPVRGVNTKLVFADGEERYELGNAAPLFDEKGQVSGAVGAAIDITKRVRAEEALRESEERLRLAQEVANIGTFDRNLLTGESRWTPQMMAIYGLSADAPSPTLDQVVQLTHPEDRQPFSDLLAHSMESGEGGGEWRIVWPDGTVHWIAGRWRIFNDPGGKPARMIGIDYDITGRKQIEEELRQAKEKLTEEKHYFEHAIDTEMGFEEIIGKSAGLKAVMEQVSKVATSDAPCFCSAKPAWARNWSRAPCIASACAITTALSR